MKKLIAVFLAVCLLMLPACSGEKPEETPQDNKPVFKIPERMPRPDYSVAENPTTDQLRQTAVRAMRDMLSIPWASEVEINYNKSGAVSEKDYHYDPYVVYAGLPYADGQTNIFVWYEYYDPETGVLRMEGDGQWLNKILGNTCAGSLMWAWSTVCSSLTGTFVNYDMVSRYGCIPVGDYTYDAGILTFRDLSTQTIIENNGVDKMYESYAQVKMADAVTSSPEDHAMMAVEDAVVVRFPDGSIDGNNSYIMIQDQRSGYGAGFYEGNLHGRLNHKYTFYDLLKEYYIPVTTAEFAGTKPYEKPVVEFQGDQSDLAKVFTGSLKSNYPMSVVNFIATDKDGNTTVLNSVYINRKDVGSGRARLLPLSGGYSQQVNNGLADMPAGEYIISIEVTDSTGQVSVPVSVAYKK